GTRHDTSLWLGSREVVWMVAPPGFKPRVLTGDRPTGSLHLQPVSNDFALTTKATERFLLSHTALNIGRSCETSYRPLRWHAPQPPAVAGDARGLPGDRRLPHAHHALPP